MELYRKTYAEINLGNIRDNVSSIIEKFNYYEYYFGVVKADCYGHNGILSVKAVLDGGCNYLAVATLDEALTIRKEFIDIPILCLGITPLEYLEVCSSNNITVTIGSLDYAKKVYESGISDLKVHIKINTGMNRLGICSKDEFNETFRLLDKSGIFVEGVYTHMYNACDKDITFKQFSRYEEIVSDIDKNRISIFHTSASDAMSLYGKLPFINGCRLGIIMYGLASDKSLNLKSTFRLCSEVIQINTLSSGDSVGYNGNYVALDDNEKIAVIPIGYADGVIRKNTGRHVYINDKSFPIVGNICMDMMFVKVDDSVKVGDKVLILKDNAHIEEVAEHLDTISYEVLCSVGKRVPRIYFDKNA